VTAQTLRMARGHEPSITLAMPKAVQVNRARVDDFDPTVQNWEVEIDLMQTDPQRPDRDELLVAWMTGRTGDDGLTDTRLALARSIDSGRSFTLVDLQIPLPAPSIPFDPTIEFDRIAQRAYVSAMGQSPGFLRNVWVAASSESDSASFDAGVVLTRAASASPDKGWLASGPAPDLSGDSILYLAERDGVRASHDAGRTWSTPVLLPHQHNLLQPLVLPDATLIVSYLGRGGDQALFTRSDDGAQTFSTPVAIHNFAASLSEISNPVLPGGFRAPPTTMIARNPINGHLFAVLHDVTRRQGDEADLDLLLYESSNQGQTWSSGRNITFDLPAWSDQFLPWIGVDRAGHLHLAYFDTGRHPGTDQAHSALVDVWYATSTDGGLSWGRTRLTDDAIDSLGTRWAPTANVFDAQFIGDYFTLTVSDHAVYVAHPVFEDGVYGMAVSSVGLDIPAASTIRDPRGLSGLWYEPATSGQGFTFHWLDGDQLAVAYYGHHDDGSNFFLVGVHPGRFGYDEPLEIALSATAGGRFNDFDPGTIRSTPWGSLRLQFASCAQATARISGLDGVQELALIRLAPAPGLLCD
jgi:hypothetical protein